MNIVSGRRLRFMTIHECARMAEDKIIRFPGLAGAAKKPPVAEAPAASEVGPDGMTEHQRKAMQCILSGMSFVFVGIKPTQTGADFYTAVHGDHGDLRNSLDHLPGVIERAYSRAGVLSE